MDNPTDAPTLPSTPPDPQSPLFGNPPLPARFTEFRDHQWDTILAINDGFLHDDVVVLQAPTGAGKSYIAEVTRRLLQRNGLLACTTKSLQDQYVRDFSYAEVVKGRANYLTQSGVLDDFGNPVHDNTIPSSITCEDCTFSFDTGKCNWCADRLGCPYLVARNRASIAQLAVLNTSYLLADFRKGQGSSLFMNRGLTTIDEADEIENTLLSNIEVVISASRRRKLGLNPPTKKTVKESWIDWCESHAIPRVLERMESFPHPKNIKSAGQRRELRSLSNLLGSLRELHTGLPSGRWVYDGYNDRYPSESRIIFRPVFVNNYGNNLLWKNTRKVLLMSATVLSPDMFVDDIGLRKSYTFVDVPSTFPPANRPIHIVPVANMTYANKADAWPKMVRGIEGVLRNHPNERILIHTVSYAFSSYLKERMESATRPIITYKSAPERDNALARYKAHTAAVLLAPSMDRGIDLPDDLCRVQVVAKIPWPNTADKRINARMYVSNGRTWYTVQAIRTLIQMTGRGVRSPTDHAVTYILDEQFGSNLWKSQHLFPKWWVEAVNWRFPRHKLMGGG